MFARVDDELTSGPEFPFVAMQGVFVELGDREVAVPGDAAVETKLAELAA
jgi:hypothetical protein